MPVNWSRAGRLVCARAGLRLLGFSRGDEEHGADEKGLAEEVESDGGRERVVAVVEADLGEDSQAARETEHEGEHRAEDAKHPVLVFHDPASLPLVSGLRFGRVCHPTRGRKRHL